MIKKNILFRNNIQKKYLNEYFKKELTKKLQNVFKEVNYKINNTETTYNILSNNFRFNFKNKDLQKFKKFKKIAIIGMGGSVLGSEAIHEFLKNKIKKKIYFFNDLDPKKIFNFKKKNNLNKMLFLIISKSGETVETLANFFSLNILKNKNKNIILISEKNDSLLCTVSKKFKLFYIEHKKNISGRYSVLSEAGIVPAYLMGVNTSRLRSNIQKFLKNRGKLFLKESSIKLASLLKSKKINNLIFLNYSPELEKFLFWCQQLIAESLGKKGKGFLPMISNVPKDHHSLLQLYLDGPKDKIFHIFSLEENFKEKLEIKKINKRNNFLHKKTLNEVKTAQKEALIKAFKRNKIPFREFKIKAINEEVLGELFSYFILETILISKLIGVNPFDQPAVEQVKIYTKKLLS